MMLLTGCAGGISSNALPPLVKYDDEFQAKAAEEIDSLGDGFPHVKILIVDYGKVRDQIRAGEQIQ